MSKYFWKYSDFQASETGVKNKKHLFKVNYKDIRTTSLEGRYFLTGFSSR